MGAPPSEVDGGGVVTGTEAGNFPMSILANLSAGGRFLC